MNRETARLRAATERLAVRVNPEVVDGGMFLTAGNVAAVIHKIENARRWSSVAVLAVRLLGNGRDGVTLSFADTDRLALALERVRVTLDRAEAANSGRFTCPMSGSEAVAWSLARARRGF